MKIIVDLTGRDRILRPEEIVLSSALDDPDAVLDLGRDLRLRLPYDLGKAVWAELGRRYDLPSADVAPARPEADPA